MRIPLAVNPRFPQPCSSAEGEPDPKVRPKGVTDGKRVNIPALLRFDQDRRGDAARKPVCAMVSKTGPVAKRRGKSAVSSARKIL